MTEPFSLSSNADSLSYTGAGSSDQWSLQAASWSLLSSSTSADQHFSHSQTQFQPCEFQSLPDTVVTDSYNVRHGQVLPYGLSLGSQVIGYDAENLTLASAADNTASYGGSSSVPRRHLSASAGHVASEHVAPIPAFVTNASYDGMFFIRQMDFLKLTVPRVGFGAHVWYHCRISPPRFLAECRKRRLNQGNLVFLYFNFSALFDLYLVFACLFSCTVFVFSYCMFIFLYCFVCQYQSSDWL